MSIYNYTYYEGSGRILYTFTKVLDWNKNEKHNDDVINLQPKT